MTRQKQSEFFRARKVRAEDLDQIFKSALTCRHSYGTVWRNELQNKMEKRLRKRIVKMPRNVAGKVLESSLNGNYIAEEILLQATAIFYFTK